MTEDNVVSIPPLLDRLARKLKTLLTQEAANRQEWIAIQEDICLTLVEARSQFSANIAFGRWCADNGFGEDAISHHNRAAAIAMAKEPEALRKSLEETHRRSLETIYKFDFPRFTNIRKTTRRNSETGEKPISNFASFENVFKTGVQPKRQRKETPAPKKMAAREVVRPFVEEGRPIDRKALAKQAGVSGHCIQMAVECEKGRLEGLREAGGAAPVEALDPARMAPTIQQRYEAALRGAKQQIRLELMAEVRAEVNKEYELYLTHWRDKCARADKILASHQGVMTRKNFRIVLAGLHPDHNKFEQAQAAVVLFKSLEKVLVKPDEPVFSGPPLPSSVAEMMARRKTRR